MMMGGGGGGKKENSALINMTAILRTINHKEDQISPCPESTFAALSYFMFESNRELFSSYVGLKSFA